MFVRGDHYVKILRATVQETFNNIAVALCQEVW